MLVIKEHYERFADFGVIVVPEDYVHGRRMSEFLDEHYSHFSYYNTTINDRRFAKPSCILKPYDRIHVQGYVSALPGFVSQTEWYKFLESEKSVFLGPQGLSLLWERKHDSIPRDRIYVATDHKNRLPKYERARMSPGLQVAEDGRFCMVAVGENIPSDKYVFLHFKLLEPAKPFVLDRPESFFGGNN